MTTTPPETGMMPNTATNEWTIAALSNGERT